MSLFFVDIGPTGGGFTTTAESIRKIGRMTSTGKEIGKAENMRTGQRIAGDGVHHTFAMAKFAT